MRRIILLLFFLLSISGAVRAADFMDSVKHGYVDNAGVKIHYVTLGVIWLENRRKDGGGVDYEK